MVTIGQIAKRVFRWLGIEAYSRRHMPWGMSLERDIERLLPRLESPPTFFDVGANTGQTALRFRKMSKTAAIYAFEPVTDTFRGLKGSVGADRRVFPFQLALGERNGVELMEMHEESQLNRVARGPVRSGSRTEEVRMMTLDSFCEEMSVRSIDMLKTDCEGFDLEVLMGAACALSEQRIASVLCEVNLRRDGRHADFFSVHELLSAHGYYFFAFYDYNGWGIRHSEGSFQNALWLSLPMNTKHDVSVGAHA